MDEWNTSKMCPKCKETYTDFVKNSHVRIKYCDSCGIKFHRDIMAAQNIANKGLSQIYKDKRIASYLGERPKKGSGKSGSQSQSKGKGKRKLDDSSSAEVSQTQRKRHCGNCGEAGHNKKTCFNFQKGDESHQSEEDNSPGPNFQREDEIELDDSEEIIILGPSSSQREDEDDSEEDSDDSEEDNSPGPSNSQKKGKRKWNGSPSEEANRSNRPRTHQPILKLKFDGQVCA